MDNKLILPIAALCMYGAGCVAYEQPIYHRAPTYVTPATTTYVTEPAYVAPVTYSTTTYVAEPVYIDGGYRHHSVGRVPLHGKHGSGPRHSTQGPRISTHKPPRGPNVKAPAPQKSAIHSSHSAQKSAAHSAKLTQKAAAKAAKHH